MTLLSLRQAILHVPDSIRLGQFTLTKQPGQLISFVCPVTNSGDADGVAFIKATETLSGFSWVGVPFVIPLGTTVEVNMVKTVDTNDLPLGPHSLTVEMREGEPPDGLRAIDTRTLELSIVSTPILAPVGLPNICGVEGAQVISFERSFSTIIPISWPCHNSGSGAGSARLKLTQTPFYQNFNSGLATIPGGATVTLLVSFSTIRTIGGLAYTFRLQMVDGNDVLLPGGEYFFTGIGPFGQTIPCIVTS